MSNPGYRDPRDRTESRHEQAPPVGQQATAPAFSESAAVPVLDATTSTNGTPAVEVTERTATAGRAGEKNIEIEWVPVRVGNDLPVFWNVRTSSGNALEVTVEQKVYNRAYTGNGSVKTHVIPVAPIGTPLKISVRDVTTGETREEKGVWKSLSTSFFARIVAAIKSTFGA
jgi:hypothetical protein